MGFEAYDISELRVANPTGERPVVLMHTDNNPPPPVEDLSIPESRRKVDVLINP